MLFPKLSSTNLLMEYLLFLDYEGSGDEYDDSEPGINVIKPFFKHFYLSRKH